MNNHKKRSWVYVEKPEVFEVSPCDCGNLHTEWSEYESHLWCESCNKDFIPTNFGILESPIPMQVSKMMGIGFTRYDLVNHKYFVLDDDFCYKEVLSANDFLRGGSIIIEIKYIYDLNITNSVYLKLNPKDKNSILFDCKERLTDGAYKSQFYLLNDKIHKFSLVFSVVSGNLEIVKDDNFDLFSKKINFLSLDLDLPNDNDRGKISKI